MSIDYAIDRIYDILYSDILYDGEVDYQLTRDDFDWLNTALDALRFQRKAESGESMTTG